MKYQQFICEISSFASLTLVFSQLMIIAVRCLEPLF